MNIVMLSTDENILKSGTESQQRIVEYYGLFNGAHIIVYSHSSFNYKKKQIANNVFIYPIKPNRLLYFFRAYKIAAEILKEKGEWIITTQDPFETGAVGYKLKKNFKIPLYIQAHTDFLSPYFKKESVKNKIRVFLAKKYMKQADAIRVVSERIKKRLIVFDVSLESRITVLPVFVDTEKFQKTEPSINLHERYPVHKFIFLMASRITREKNIQLALTALHKLVSKYPQTLLLIIGEGGELKRLQKKTHELNIESNIIFRPWTEEVDSYLKTADAFILTSNYEGYGRTLVEAQAAGIPIITTDVGCAREVVRDNETGFIIPIGDEKKLRMSMEYLLEGKPLKQVQNIVSEKEEYKKTFKRFFIS